MLESGVKKSNFSPVPLDCFIADMSSDVNGILVDSFIGMNVCI